MNLHPDPKAMRMVLRSKLDERARLEKHFPWQHARIAELTDQERELRAALIELCGDDDVKTPEAWR